MTRGATDGRILTPKQDFYELFDEVQRLEIVENIERFREIPNSCAYFAAGAQTWVEHVEQMAGEAGPNLYNRTQRLLQLNFPYLDEVLAHHDVVNVVDIGAGDGRPARALLARLQAQKVLGTYIALDSSTDLLETATDSVREWSDGQIKPEGHVIDVTKDGFGRLMKKGVTVALMFGGTPFNLRDPDEALRKIHQSLRPGDLFIHAGKLDSETARGFFPGYREDRSVLNDDDRLVLDLLGVTPDLYEVEMGYSERMRFIRVRLLEAVERSLDVRRVKLGKGETVLLWRSWHKGPAEVLDQMLRTGFYPLQLSQYPDREYMVCISIK